MIPQKNNRSLTPAQGPVTLTNPSARHVSPARKEEFQPKMPPPAPSLGPAIPDGYPTFFDLNKKEESSSHSNSPRSPSPASR